MAEFTVGLVLLAAVLYDLFQSVVLPRPAARKFQLARLIVRPMWWTWRWLFMRGTKVERTESRLAVFGPIALLTLFGVWASRSSSPTASCSTPFGISSGPRS